MRLSIYDPPRLLDEECEPSMCMYFFARIPPSLSDSGIDFDRELKVGMPTPENSLFALNRHEEEWRTMFSGRT